MKSYKSSAHRESICFVASHSNTHLSCVVASLGRSWESSVLYWCVRVLSAHFSISFLVMSPVCPFPFVPFSSITVLFLSLEIRRSSKMVLCLQIVKEESFFLAHFKSLNVILNCCVLINCDYWSEFASLLYAQQWIK